MKKIVALTAVLLVLVFSMDSDITGTHRACASDIVSEVTGETAPPVPPIADADGPYSCYVHETILLDGSGSYDPDGTIVKYEWSFGDETTGTGEKPSHTYSTTGTFPVTLTVTDNHDLTDDDTTTVEVTSRPQPPPSPPPLPPPNKNPKSDVGPNQKVWVNRTILFSGAGSYDEDGIIISYNWDFSDGRMALGVDVSHVYSEPGHHTVTLTVKDNRYGEDSDTCIVKVYEVPAPIVGELSELVPAGKKGHIVNASKEANTTITLNTTSRVTVTVLKYECNPYPEDPINATTVPLYADVMVSITEAVEWPIYLEMEYTDDEVEGLNESSLGIYLWFNGTWEKCNDTGVDTERNVVWAYMTAEEAAGSPILIGGITLPKPAEFVVSYLKIDPRQIELGGTVTISVNVTNIGEEKGDYIVTLDLPVGPYLREKTVSLEGGESEIIEFEFAPEAEGTYDVDIEGMIGIIYVIVPIPVPPLPPYLSNLTVTPTEIELGDNVTISLDIRDMHNQSFTYTVTMKIDQLTLLIDVELEPYEAKTVSRTITPEMIGEYHVWVQDLTGGFTVKDLPKPAEFEFSNLVINPEKVEEGLSATISVDVTNLGKESLLTPPILVELKLDGLVVDSVEIPPFGGGVTATQYFEVTRGKGTYEVEVGGLTGSFTVQPIVPFWMRPETIAGIIIVIIAAATILYAKWKGILPSLYPEIDDEIK